MSGKPKECPRCGCGSIASILYGMPAFDEEMESKLNSGKIVIGGCCVSDNDPQWHCNDCDHEWAAEEKES